MQTFVLFGKYSAEAIKGVSAKRTNEAVALIEKLGGKVEAMYILLGKFDLMLIVSLPGMQEAIKASVALAKTTGIGFTTAPAVSVAEFDKMMAKS